MGFAAKYDIGDKVWILGDWQAPVESAVVITVCSSREWGTEYYVNGLWWVQENELCTHETWHERDRI